MSFMCHWIAFVLAFSILPCLISADTRPNFIYILTDDQDLLFNSVNVMPSLLQNVRDDGIDFKNAFVATSICCPSRTETLTGRYFQNIRLQTESMNNCMHVAAEYNVLNNTQSMFQMLSKSGYITGVFGKMTNDQTQWWCTPVQNNQKPYIHGYSRVNIPCAEDYYQLLWFDKYMNGTYELHNLSTSTNKNLASPANYYTSVIGNASVKFLKDVLKSESSAPFMLWIGPHAPHGPSTPAEWYADKFKNKEAPRTPTYNLHSPNKISWIATNPRINNNSAYYIDQEARNRLRTLLSVDDIIEKIFKVLHNYPKVLNNTYVIYTSDHGYHLGEWRVPHHKHLPYDTDLRVPMFMRGPLIKPGSVSLDVVGNIDVLPTILSLAGIEYDNNTYDGVDWTQIFDGYSNSNTNWKREVYLSQYISINTNKNGGSSWFPNNDGSLYPGQKESAGCCNEDGQPWFCDDAQTGNWRAVRIVNGTDNVVYIEWYQLDPQNIVWNDTVFDKPIHYEFYNLTDDAWQIDNLYANFSKSKQEELHNMLMKYGNCKGTNCH
eukprot:243963_1